MQTNIAEVSAPMTAGVQASMPVSKKRLIVNADDLGLSRGITDGILLAHLQGIVTSTSFMVNQPASEYAVSQLHSVPTLDVGFLSPVQMARKLTFWQASSKEIEAEFCAQIDKAMDLGLKPSHADSHHRFHFYPAAAMAFERAVRSRGIFRARAARKVYWPADGNASQAHAGSLLRRTSVYAYNEFLQNVLFRRLTLPDAGVAFHPAFRGRLEKLPSAWNFTLKNMPEGTYEIWCHPGFPEPSFSEADRLKQQRFLEIKILTAPQLSANVRDAGIELTAFNQL
jgi:predicted glycoside hydrolase/deacetylase ChbG (UPF0249 family)